MSHTILAESIIDGTIVQIAAPAVGIAIDLPDEGAWLAPGARIGWFRRLNRRLELRLPDGVSGRVNNRCSRNREVAVEYRQPLFELQTLAEDALATREDRSAGTSAADGSGEGRVISAPTDGVFYRRATPEDPPFIEAGQTIGRGQTLGLIEVMKTFNQIAFEGPGVPESAEVLEVLVEDSQEVAAGQALIRYRG